jgi:hypothetical protein
MREVLPNDARSQLTCVKACEASAHFFEHGGERSLKKGLVLLASQLWSDRASAGWLPLGLTAMSLSSVNLRSNTNFAVNPN